MANVNMTQQSSSSSLRSKKPAKSSKDSTGVLKRSASTPNTAALKQSGTQDQTSSSGSAVEKKRNKLNYHRSSIACSHCRRRKIRCILSDIQSQCENCIRLKKDCSFHPVDQQSNGEDGLKQASQSSAVSSVASEASSPGGAGGESPADMSINQSYMHMAVAPVPSMGPLSNTAHSEDYFGNDVKVPLQGLPANGQYGVNSQQSQAWLSDDTNSNPMSRPEDITTAWRSYTADSPMSAQFSPYSQASAASASWTAGNIESGPQDTYGWCQYPPPTRSMSYSGEVTGGQQQAQMFAIPPNQPLPRRPSAFSDQYTPLVGVPYGAIEGQPLGPVMDHSASLSPGTIPQVPAGMWQPQMMMQEQDPYPRQNNPFGDWGFGEAGNGSQS